MIEKYRKEIEFLGFTLDQIQKVEEKGDKVLFYITDDLIITVIA